MYSLYLTALAVVRHVTITLGIPQLTHDIQSLESSQGVDYFDRYSKIIPMVGYTAHCTLDPFLNYYLSVY